MNFLSVIETYNYQDNNLHYYLSYQDDSLVSIVFQQLHSHFIYRMLCAILKSDTALNFITPNIPTFWNNSSKHF